MRCLCPETCLFGHDTRSVSSWKSKNRRNVSQATLAKLIFPITSWLVKTKTLHILVGLISSALVAAVALVCSLHWKGNPNFPQGINKPTINNNNNINKVQRKRVNWFEGLYMHICAFQEGRTDLESRLLERLKMCVQSCLTLASAQGFQSIVFPSLGTGVLGYPPDRVAQTMFTAVENFFKEMPHSSLQHVNICCYHKDKDLIKVNFNIF